MKDRILRSKAAALLECYHGDLAYHRSFNIAEADGMNHYTAVTRCFETYEQIEEYLAQIMSVIDALREDD